MRQEQLRMTVELEALLEIQRQQEDTTRGEKALPGMPTLLLLREAREHRLLRTRVEENQLGMLRVELREATIRALRQARRATTLALRDQQHLQRTQRRETEPTMPATSSPPQVFHISALRSAVAVSVNFVVCAFAKSSHRDPVCDQRQINVVNHD